MMILRDTFPASSCQNSHNLSFGNLKLLSKCCPSPSNRGIGIANLYNIINRQPGHPVIDPSSNFMRHSLRSVSIPSGLSMFFYFICDIFCVCSKPEMLRVGTGRIVAFMQNIKSFGDFSKMKHPRNSMRSMPLTFSLMPSRNGAIPHAHKIPGPLPTSICFYDKRPKLIFNGFSCPTIPCFSFFHYLAIAHIRTRLQIQL